MVPVYGDLHLIQIDRQDRPLQGLGTRLITLHRGSPRIAGFRLARILALREGRLDPCCHPF